METKELERPWECECCGLVHQHFSDIDHNLNGLRLGPSSVIRELEWNPKCHCGWYELSHKLRNNEVQLPRELAEFIIEASRRLPVPSKVEEAIDESE